MRIRINLTCDADVWNRFYHILNTTHGQGSASAWVEARMREYIRAYDVAQPEPELITCKCGSRYSELLEKCPNCGVITCENVE